MENMNDRSILENALTAIFYGETWNPPGVIPLAERLAAELSREGFKIVSFPSFD